jgi:hypothetical protein
MSPTWKAILWHQFSAAIENFQNALNACPDELWQVRLWQGEGHPEFGDFWYVCYHTIFWLDHYCSDSADTFTAHPPFTHTEPEFDYVLPERVYTKPELLQYLDYASNKCHTKIENLIDENEPQRIRSDWDIHTVAELLLYTMRHVEEHGAQLNFFLGQKNISASNGVAQGAST